MNRLFINVSRHVVAESSSTYKYKCSRYLINITKSCLDQHEFETSDKFLGTIELFSNESTAIAEQSVI